MLHRGELALYDDKLSDGSDIGGVLLSVECAYDCVQEIEVPQEGLNAKRVARR